MIGLALATIVPFLAVAALVILLLRAVIGFSRFDKRMTAKKLGFREIAFGAMTVFAWSWATLSDGNSHLEF